MSCDNVDKDIRQLVAEILEIEPDEVKDDAHFVKDLGMDSMMALEIMAGIEKKYRISIPEETLPKFIDVRETVRIIKEILNKNG